MRAILKATFTLDVLLHILLGALQVAALMLMLRFMPPLMAAIIFATWALFLRELTQLQSTKYGYDFRRGWGLDGSLHRQMEWIAPGLFLVMIGLWILL